MAWDIFVTSQVKEFLTIIEGADLNSFESVDEAIQVLARNGPTQGRPLVDRIAGSALANMKELRPHPRAAPRSGFCSSSTRGGRRFCS